MEYNDFDAMNIVWGHPDEWMSDEDIEDWAAEQMEKHIESERFFEKHGFYQEQVDIPF